MRGGGCTENRKALFVGTELFVLTEVRWRAYAVTGCSVLTRTGVSHPKRSGLRPLAIPRNSVPSCWVMGPGLPSAMTMRSMERMGVTSAAVPVKKTSSAM